MPYCFSCHRFSGLADLNSLFRSVYSISASFPILLKAFATWPSICQRRTFEQPLIWTLKHSKRWTLHLKNLPYLSQSRSYRFRFYSLKWSFAAAFSYSPSTDRSRFSEASELPVLIIRPCLCSWGANRAQHSPPPSRLCFSSFGI